MLFLDILLQSFSLGDFLEQGFLTFETYNPFFDDHKHLLLVPARALAVTGFTGVKDVTGRLPSTFDMLIWVNTS